MVNIYTKNNCIQCKMTKNLLDKLDIQYNEINIEQNPNELEALKKRGVKRMPFIEVKATKENWSGFQPDKIQSLV